MSPRQERGPGSGAAKRELRRRMGDWRRALPAAAAAAAGEAVARHFLAEPRLARAGRVALYAARPDELPTRPLFEALCAAGAGVLLPRTRPGRRLEFAAVERWDELRPGRYAVLEPPGDRPAAALGAGDAVVLPGLAFDRRGHRLGRGGGYYDRALAPGSPASFVLRVGLGYEYQLVAAVPHDVWDRRVHAVVTERGARWISE